MFLANNVIIDDYDEFHSDNEYPDDRFQKSDEEQNTDFKYKNSRDNNSCLINEDLGQDLDDEIHENISVIENEDVEDNIPFHIDEESQHSINDDEFHENELYEEIVEDKDTLKQMRMIFGSEQRIREQSEAAIHQMESHESEVYEPNELDNDEFQTPGISQSQYDQKASLSKSNMFMKNSFQEFSMKKFQEVMFENNISDFIDSVERSVRENAAKINTKVLTNLEKSMTPK